MIDQIVRRIERKLAGIRLAFRGVITLVNAASSVQLVQLNGLSDEQLQDAELFQQYGCTTNPPNGTMAIVLPIGGKTSHGVIIATEHGSYRLKNLKPGEVALYSDEGDSVILKRGRVIDVTTETFRVTASTAIELISPTITGNASSKVVLNTPLVSASQDIVAAGEVSDHSNKTMSGMRQVFNSHDHDENNVSGGSTDEPNEAM